jgi:hypothetical protein
MLMDMDEMIEQIMDLIEEATSDAYAQGTRQHGFDRMPGLERRLETIITKHLNTTGEA